MSNDEIMRLNYTLFKDNVDSEYEAVKLHVAEKINIGLCRFMCGNHISYDEEGWYVT